MSVIGANEREQLIEQGYLLVENVVPAELCEAVVDAIGRFLGIDPRDPNDWFRHPLEGHGIVPLHHDQALWDVRQHPRVYELFCDIYGHGKLTVTQDRVSFKPPAAGFEAEPRVDPVHWDAAPHELRASGRLAVQGLVYLTDTAADQGGFACVPNLYRNIDAWLEAHPPGERRPDCREEDLVSVTGPQGSMVIWHRLMPHTSMRNHGNRPRMVQYVAMDDRMPVASRAERVRDCLEKRPPAWALAQKVPGQQNPEPGPPPVLTPLGRRLAEIDPW